MITKPKLNFKDSRLSKYLKEKRVESNMTQQDLGTILGYSPQFIANWERGASCPPAHILHKIVSVLNIPEEEILQILVEESMSYWRDVIQPQAGTQFKQRSRG